MLDNSAVRSLQPIQPYEKKILAVLVKTDGSIPYK